MDSLWKLGDEFRGQTKNSEDYQWSVMTSKLAELTRSKVGRQNNLDYSKNVIEAKAYNKVEYHEDNKLDSINLGLMNLDLKINDASVKSLFHGAYSMSNAYQKNNANEINSFKLDYINKYAKNSANKEVNYNKNDTNTYSNINSNSNCNNNAIVDKRFKTLPSTEMLPRNEILGGYIFVCNNDTMQEDLKRQLFGLPPRYRDSVRAITPGLPLFLYNYTTHQLHGIFEAASFGGSNIDPTAWEDKKCKGVSRFPAQVRIRVRKLCKALEEDAFRPVLYHYDGPKFRLELSISETLQLLDLCEKEGHIRL
ncbi:B2 protein-like [Zingiber officinale]|uniref:B2 protein-like n=1 Tax=Zingiber officinale TaxID=94328 RepID=UPI001C4D6998|nr:B2 protein-like [Zingiber officinale]XP_042451018.1 B2 protein-like [Zingiber officinale]